VRPALTGSAASDFSTARSIDGGTGGGGVTQLPFPSLIIPGGTVSWTPGMFGQTSVGGGGGGVTQLPLASLIIPAGIVSWTPGMFGQTSVGGGGTQLPFASLIRPGGIVAWSPGMFGQTSTGGGGFSRVVTHRYDGTWNLPVAGFTGACRPVPDVVPSGA
jgi:hypothetical protein